MLNWIYERGATDQYQMVTDPTERATVTSRLLAVISTMVKERWYDGEKCTGGSFTLL